MKKQVLFHNKTCTSSNNKYGQIVLLADLESMYQDYVYCLDDYICLSQSCYIPHHRCTVHNYIYQQIITWVSTSGFEIRILRVIKHKN